MTSRKEAPSRKALDGDQSDASVHPPTPPYPLPMVQCASRGESLADHQVSRMNNFADQLGVGIICCSKIEYKQARTGKYVHVVGPPVDDAMDSEESTLRKAVHTT